MEVVVSSNARELGNCYYILFVMYVSLLLYNLHEIFVTVFRFSRKLWVRQVGRSSSTSSASGVHLLPAECYF
jgi:hypothetical protein